MVGVIVKFDNNELEIRKYILVPFLVYVAVAFFIGFFGVTNLWLIPLAPIFTILVLYNIDLNNESFLSLAWKIFIGG